MEPEKGQIVGFLKVESTKRKVIAKNLPNFIDASFGNTGFVKLTQLFLEQPSPVKTEKVTCSL